MEYRLRRNAPGVIESRAFPDQEWEIFIVVIGDDKKDAAVWVIDAIQRYVEASENYWEGKQEGR